MLFMIYIDTTLLVLQNSYVCIEAFGCIAFIVLIKTLPVLYANYICIYIDTFE